MPRPLALLALAALLLPTASAQILFEPPQVANGGGLALRTLVGDVNEDGLPDLLVGHWVFGGAPSLSLGIAPGEFGPPQSLAPLDNAPGLFGLADFNEDGHLDLLGAIGEEPPLSLSVLLGTGTGSFDPPIGINGNFNRVADADVGDFDADGNLDVAISNGVFGFSNGSILAVFGDGLGGFGAPVMLVSPNQLVFGSSPLLRVGDANGDGFDDIVYTTAAVTPTLLSQGDGTFAAVACGQAGCGLMSDREFVMADVNADGRDDIVTNRRVMPAKPDGSFGFGQFFPSAQLPWTVGVGDLDDDGIDDVVLGRNWTSSDLDPGQTVGDVLVLRGNGDGSFQTPGVVVSAVPQPRSVTIADVDVDGRPDIVVGEFQFQPAGVRVLLNHTYPDGSPFLDLGSALGGTNGYPIQLASGTLVPGQPFAFRLAKGKPSGAAYHIIGLAALNAPFKGGTMIPALHLINGPFLANASGDLNLAGNAWPAGGSGLTLWLQFWMPNGGGPAGLISTSGVRAQLP